MSFRVVLFRKTLLSNFTYKCSYGIFDCIIKFKTALDPLSESSKTIQNTLGTDPSVFWSLVNSAYWTDLSYVGVALLNILLVGF